MGVDLYAGSLTRYFSGQWATTVTRPWLAAEDAKPAVFSFVRRLCEYNGLPGWNERIDAPYETWNLDPRGVNSLALADEVAVFGAHLFVPGNAELLVSRTDPLGSTRVVSTTGALLAKLNALNERVYRASEEEMERWYQRGQFDDADDLVAHDAQYAIACFQRACRFSLQHNVPIVVDR